MANASFGGYCAATVSVHGDFLTSFIHIVQQYTEKGSLCQSLGQPGRLYRKNAFVRSSDRQEELANGEKEAVPVLGKVRYSVNRSVNVRNIGNRTPAPGWAYAACRQENTSRPPRCCQCPYAPLTGVARPPERAPRGIVYEPDLRLLRSDNIRSGAISFARQGWYT